ncbi:hypothetical protein HYE10_02880 [Mycoplasmopsis bovis]|nr:hypothetical protein HYE10_02880 [Mycoplasmopsis bovis]
MITTKASKGQKTKTKNFIDLLYTFLIIIYLYFKNLFEKYKIIWMVTNYYLKAYKTDILVKINQFVDLIYCLTKLFLNT